MRLPRVRFTVRRLLVVVAVIAVVTWGGKMVGRRNHALKLAAQYRKDATLFAKGERLYAEKVREAQEQIAEIAKRNALDEKVAAQLTGEGKKHWAVAQSLQDSLDDMNLSLINGDVQELAHYSALSRHFKLLEAKYKIVAARPWLYVEPDPPTPNE